MSDLNFDKMRVVDLKKELATRGLETKVTHNGAYTSSRCTVVLSMLQRSEHLVSVVTESDVQSAERVGRSGYVTRTAPTSFLSAPTGEKS